MLIWLCGLSGSGKTTLGRLLYERLNERYPNLVLLDGDELRQAFGDDIGHHPEARQRNSQRIANLCHLLAQQGIHVICCAVTLTKAVQEQNRRLGADYVEVFLNVSLDTLRRRDPKRIYERASRGEISDVAGVDIPYVPPADPHLTIDNDDERTDLTPLVARILDAAPLRSPVGG
jgi:adenylylsulfate kinase-like enzyme